MYLSSEFSTSTPNPYLQYSETLQAIWSVLRYCRVTCYGPRVYCILLIFRLTGTVLNPTRAGIREATEIKVAASRSQSPSIIQQQTHPSWVQPQANNPSSHGEKKFREKKAKSIITPCNNHPSMLNRSPDS